jgi:hypothetical protein
LFFLRFYANFGHVTAPMKNCNCAVTEHNAT